MAMAAAIVLHSCGGQETRLDQAPPALKVDVVVAEPQPFESIIEVTGNILPYEEVELKTPVAGTILEILFEEGEEVKKGEVLVRIDDRAWQAEAKGLRTQITSAKNDFRRREELLKIEGASQEEVDQSRATLAGMEARLEQLEVSIDLANIKAPFSGTVGLRNFSLGTYLPQGAPITQLVQTDKLKIDFNLPSKYASYISVGKKVEVTSGQDKGVAGIYAVNPLVENTSRTVQVRALMDGDLKGFHSGDFAQVFFALGLDSNAILVPTSAVIPELNGQSVFVLEAGKVLKKQVELGERTAEQVQLMSGVEEGDSIIVSGLLQVKEGMPAQANTSSTN